MIWSRVASAATIKRVICSPRLCNSTVAASAVSATAQHAAPSSRPVAYWLFGMSGLVAGMISIGGITRLTRSGLSMTDWKLQGSLPPMNLEEWTAEFERYKLFPEYQQRKSMTLDEFKYIYFWEYSHRMMGRGLGVAFALPCAYFAARGMIPRHLYPRMAGLFALGGIQGLVGWWMVKSGLSKDIDTTREIRVTPYRLSAHLALALTTFSALAWTGLDVLHPEQKLKEIAAKTSETALAHCRKLRAPAAACLGLVAFTAVSGAFVAGNDAGRAYNTWPKMGDNWIPPNEELFEKMPIWRNFVESTALVQFDHRMMAIFTLTTIGATTALAFRGGMFHQLPTGMRHGVKGAAAVVIAQVTLGITTLLTYVPIGLAATHQIGSVVLLSTVVGLNHSFKFLKHAPSTVRLQQIAKAVAK